MYFLMNKDNQILTFEKKEGILTDIYDVIEIKDKEHLPYGFSTINAWLENRKACKHNHHLKELMQLCGCDKTEGFIEATHATSLSDTFWVKEELEQIYWENVSLYQNKFNDVISKLAFAGIGLHGLQLSDTSPELSTDGSFPKCWRRENNQIYLYKSGTNGYANAGLEPYCEVLASEIANIICPSSVAYTLTKFHNKISSKCKLFTSEEYGYVPLALLKDKEFWTPDTMLDFYEKLNSENDYRRMLVLDAITFNVDRHLGNLGIMIENDTLKPIRMAPVFDLNLALLPYATLQELEMPGDYLSTQGPKIGNDFTEIGHKALTSEIRSDLINLQGYHFKFKGNNEFQEKRVKMLETMVNKQIFSILSKDCLLTKHVFPLSFAKMQLEKKKTELFSIQEYLNTNTDCYFTIDESKYQLFTSIYNNGDEIEIVFSMDTKTLTIEPETIKNNEIENIKNILSDFYNQPILINQITKEH